MCVPMCYVLKLLSIVSNSIMDCVRSSLSLQLWGVFCTGRRPRLFWSRVPYQTPPSRLPRPGAKPFPSPVSSLVSSITSATAAMPLGFHPGGDRGCGDRGGDLGGAGSRRGGPGGKARFCWVHGSLEQVWYRCCPDSWPLFRRVPAWRPATVRRRRRRL